MRNCDLNSAWEKYPNYVMNIEKINHRIQVKFMDETIADSENVLLIKESEYNPKYYFPRDDIIEHYFQLTNNVTFCPFKGLASHWSVDVGYGRIEKAAWGYEDPFKKLISIQNYVAFYPNDDIEFIVDFFNLRYVQNIFKFQNDSTSELVLH